MPWLPASVLRAGGTLHYTLSAKPDPTWGSSPGASPPSFGAEPTPGRRVLTAERCDDRDGRAAEDDHDRLAPAGDQATTVHWQAEPDPGGLAVTPSSGTLTLAPASCTPTAPASQAVSITAPVTATGSASLRLNLSTAGGLTLPPIVIDVQVQP